MSRFFIILPIIIQILNAAVFSDFNNALSLWAETERKILNKSEGDLNFNESISLLKEIIETKNHPHRFEASVIIANNIEKLKGPKEFPSMQKCMYKLQCQEIFFDKIKSFSKPWFHKLFCLTDSVKNTPSYSDVANAFIACKQLDISIKEVKSYFLIFFKDLVKSDYRNIDSEKIYKLLTILKEDYFASSKTGKLLYEASKDKISIDVVKQSSNLKLVLKAVQNIDPLNVDSILLPMSEQLLIKEKNVEKAAIIACSSLYKSNEKSKWVNFAFKNFNQFDFFPFYNLLDHLSLQTDHEKNEFIKFFHKQINKICYEQKFLKEKDLIYMVDVFFKLLKGEVYHNEFIKVLPTLIMFTDRMSIPRSKYLIKYINESTIISSFLNKYLNKEFYRKKIRVSLKKSVVSLLVNCESASLQELALLLKNEYAPQLSSRTVAWMRFWNMEEIKKFQPKMLDDLSQLSLDISDEMEYIISLISKDEKDSLYLDLKLIGTDITLEELKNRANGFFKTLLGKKLSPHEIGGWQMYDDDKPAMINALKHIVLHIKQQIHDPKEHQYGILSLVYVLSGILHCPTGQAEGINSAIHTMIHQTDGMSSDLKNKVGNLIMASSVQKAFLNAFHDNEDVHQISKARLVLKDYLNLFQGIESFKEKIEAVDQTETPLFYNTFFNVFRAKFVVEEAYRNIQTEEDFDLFHEELVAKGEKKQQLRKLCALVKKERPISVSEIAQWIYSQKENPYEYGIDDNFKIITPKGVLKLLKLMQFCAYS